MALQVYLSREEIPKGIRVIDYNDVYFNGYTNLGTSEFEEKVLKKIDQAKRTSDMTFLGRTERLGSLAKNCLSTGSKTLLNIYHYPELCFNVMECGDNALELLAGIKKGNILWEHPFVNLSRRVVPCSIECRGKYFSELGAFLHYDWEEADAD